MLPAPAASNKRALCYRWHTAAAAFLDWHKGSPAQPELDSPPDGQLPGAQPDRADRPSGLLLPWAEDAGPVQEPGYWHSSTRAVSGIHQPAAPQPVVKRPVW